MTLLYLTPDLNLILINLCNLRLLTSPPLNLMTIMIKIKVMMTRKKEMGKRRKKEKERRKEGKEGKEREMR